MTLKAEKRRYSASALVTPERSRPEVLSARHNDVADHEGEIVHRRPNGRPTKYRDEYDQMMFDFFNIKVEKVVITELPDGKVESKVVINTFPTFGRFASKIGVSRDTLHGWAKAKNKDGTLRRPEFSDTYTRARDFQESLLIEGGISGAYDSRFVCLLAQCLLGWSHNPKQQPESASNGAMTAELERVYVDALKVAMDKATVRARNMAKLKEERKAQSAQK